MNDNENKLENDPDFLNKVLSITRVQLQRMINVNTELEALLLREQEKNNELTERLKRSEK